MRGAAQGGDAVAGVHGTLAQDPTWRIGDFFRIWWHIEQDQMIYADEFVRTINETSPIEVGPEVIGG